MLASFSLLNADTPKIPRAVVVKKCDDAVEKFKNIQDKQVEQSEEFINASIDVRALLVFLQRIDQFTVNPAFFKVAQEYIDARCVLVDRSLTDHSLGEKDLTQLREKYFEKIKTEDKNVFEEVIEYRNSLNNNNTD